MSWGTARRGRARVTCLFKCSFPGTAGCKSKKICTSSREKLFSSSDAAEAASSRLN